MQVINQQQSVKVRWNICKGASTEREDFSKVEKLAVFLMCSDDVFPMPVTVGTDGNLVVTIQPEFVLPVGVYSLKVAWLKNKNRQIPSFSEKRNLFVISDIENEATNPSASRVDIGVTSHVYSYGYDGLSAYETAFFYGVTTALSEKEYVQIRASYVDTNQIADKAITTPKIADLAVTTAKIDNKAVTSIKINDGAVTTEKIGDGEVKSVNIGSGEVKSTNIGSGEVKSVNIGSGEVKSANIGSGEVKSVNIGEGQVKSANIGSGEVKSGNIGSGEVKSVNIDEGAVVEGSIADGAVTEGKIGSGAVTEGNIAEGAVTEGKIGNGAVVEGNIAEGAVVEGNIAEGAVTSGKLAVARYDADGNYIEGSAAVQTENIADGAVTMDKLAEGAITDDKIADGTLSDFITEETERMDGIEVKVNSVLPIKDWTLTDGYIYSVDGAQKWLLSLSDVNRKSIFIPVSGKSKLTFVSNENACHYAFLKEIPTENLEEPVFATGESTIDVARNTKVEDNVPSDAVYLWVGIQRYNEDTTPVSLIIDGYDYIKGAQKEIVSTNNHVNAVEAEHGERLSKLEYKTNGVLPIRDWNLVDGYIFTYNNEEEWLLSVSTLVRKSVFIPVSGKSKLVFTSNGNVCHYAFVKYIPTSNQEAIVFATGATTKHIAKNASVSDDVPSDAEYLWIGINRQGEDTMPVSVVIDGYDYVKGTAEEIVAANESISELEAEHDERLYELANVVQSIDKWKYVDGIIIADKKWHLSYGTLERKCVLIPVEGRSEIVLETASNECYYSLLKSVPTSIVEAGAVDYASGYTDSVYCATNKKVTITNGADAKYLYLAVVRNNVSTLPKSLVIDGYDYMESVQQNINAVTFKIKDVDDLNYNDIRNSLYTGIPHIVRNHSTSSSGTAINRGWDSLFVVCDGESTFDVVNPNGVSIASKVWFSALVPSSATYLGASASVKPANAKLCVINVRNYSTGDVDYTDFRVIQESTLIERGNVVDKKMTELATHKLNFTNEDGYTKHEGVYIGTRGGVTTEYELSSMNYLEYTIDSTKSYRVSGVGATSPSYVIYCVYYYNTAKGWYGAQHYVTGGAVLNELYLDIPSDAEKFALNFQNTLPNPTIESITIDDGIYLADVMSKKIDSLSKQGGSTKVVVKEGGLYTRCKLNANEDLIVEYVIGKNNQYTWKAAYLGGKDESDTDILGKMIQTMSDSTGAFCNTSSAPWHMWAQHGLCIPKIVATHSLTSADVGSVWKDQLEREFKIGGIDGTTIYLIPKKKATDIDGVYTSDWKTPSSEKVTSLTHVSGATHTSAITATSCTDTQLYAMMVLKSRVLMADGVKIEGNGEYWCNDFIISETFNCVDPWSIASYNPIVMGDAGAELTQTFAIHGLSCRLDVVLNMKKPYKFSWYGGNQVQHFVNISTLPNYTAYGMLPRVKRLNSGARMDIPHDISNTARGSEFALRRAEDLYDVNKMPDRFISWMQNGSTKKIGCASGLSLVKGISVDAKRVNYIPMYVSGYEDCMSVSSSLGNKAYLKAVVKDAFDNGVIPASFIGSISTYLTYFNPNENEGQVYWYKDSDGYVVYAHYQEANGKIEVNLPAEMEGMKATIVDKTDGVSLLTDFVANGKLYVSADSSDRNYIVIKVS